MIKRTLTALILAVSVVFSFSVSAFAASGAIAQNPAYSTVTEVEDWGACFTKIIVNLGGGRTVTKGSVSKDTFKVHLVKYQEDGKTQLQIHDPSDITWQNPNKMIPLEGGDRIITDAYVSDSSGNPVSSSNFVTLELKISQDDNLSTALYAKEAYAAAWNVPAFTITQQKDMNSNVGIISGLKITNSKGGVRKLVDEFKTGRYTNSEDNVTLTFADYVPKEDNNKNPLIIWLHGLGEGGTDPTATISGNKACNFASEKIQKYFGGAYVLAPQAPTYWMEGINGGAIGSSSGFGDGTSRYEKALMGLIKDYVSKHNDIDTNRIYIGGDSNGGYMTMLMIRDYGDYFAAAMPTCEALKDTLITDKQIEGMKNIPIWFTAAKTDTLVPVDQYINPTYDRLIKAGAKNAHKSLFDKVVDTTGLYKNKDGTPYEYFGHSSWIYVYNNECTSEINGKSKTIMEWLADQTLKNRS
ncbi:prolyl oligopeptidase family serine peptidase [Clostridium saccharoperbutylacetonicum]|uniref:prolyl oligopeptidase family serine peptidase n=1 Tax=Clostridium saccharoperbutylacetonicum TaxID=36745 RepID=UPI0039E82E75